MASRNSELKRGDIIYCRLGFAPGYHYGIFIDKKTVIDFSREGIKQKNLAEFSGGYEVHSEE